MKFLILITLMLFFTENSMANHLKNSLSPYLLQHKDNPVDWYGWGKEAFNKAKKEHKLIFLSIGYSTCHWCHEMAHESFEDKEVAKVLNKYYVSIKVDKEQMPHIDNFYQLGYRIVNKKSGGWPLTIILTPDRKPIFFATYIPKYAEYGSQGLLKILHTYATYDRKKLEIKGEAIENAIKAYQTLQPKEQKIENALATKALREYAKTFDTKYKGFGNHPKFPQASTLNLLLDIYLLNGDKSALKMANETLEAMAKGGIYDQINGGFFRYSVNRDWSIPHFEKMLYTNAELLCVYAKAYKITKNRLYKEVIDATIKEMDRRFLHNGVFYSASNADSLNKNSKEVEGYFFIYEPENALSYLLAHHIDEKQAKEGLQYFGITDALTFDGESCNPQITTEKKPKDLEKIKKLLQQLQEKRVYPFIDTKINTAWNALMITAKFKSGYAKEAKNSLDRLLHLMYKNGELYHQTLLPHKATQLGLLEDYAFLGETLFEAYQITLETKYLELFKKIVAQSVQKFYKNGRWRESQDSFITYASIEDSNYKSALATNLNNLLILSEIENSRNLQNIVKKTLSHFASKIDANPAYFPTALELVLRLKSDILFIKSNKKNLQKLPLTFHYPFVYKYTTQNKKYMICGLQSCYTELKSTKEVKEFCNNRQ